MMTKLLFLSLPLLLTLSAQDKPEECRKQFREITKDAPYLSFSTDGGEMDVEGVLYVSKDGVCWNLKPKKADARTLAADKCHYIIQGARIDQLRSLNQQGRCVAWESYAKPADHLAALRLYRAEVEKAWPGNMKRWDLVRDLKLIDGEK